MNCEEKLNLILTKITAIETYIESIKTDIESSTNVELENSVNDIKVFLGLGV